MGILTSPKSEGDELGWAERLKGEIAVWSGERSGHSGSGTVTSRKGRVVQVVKKKASVAGSLIRAD